MGNPLKIERIRSIVKKTHEKYLGSICGMVSDRILAEERLQRYTTWARITAIVECLVQEKIIDHYEYCLIGEHREYMRLFKDENVSDIVIVRVMEKSIILSNTGLPFTVFDASDCINIDDNIPDGYDWEKFTVTLINFIHSIIYGSNKTLDFCIK